MSPWQMYFLSGLVVSALGAHAVFAAEQALRKILAANLMGSGVFLVLVALARRVPGVPDPVPHALVLTGIVVSVSATACALALAQRLARAEAAGADDAGPPGQATRE